MFVDTQRQTRAFHQQPCPQHELVYRLTYNESLVKLRLGHCSIAILDPLLDLSGHPSPLVYRILYYDGHCASSTCHSSLIKVLPSYVRVICCPRPLKPLLRLTRSEFIESRDMTNGTHSLAQNAISLRPCPRISLTHGGRSTIWPPAGQSFLLLSLSVSVRL